MKRFELAFEICPIALLLVSGNGEIIMTNANLDEMFEYQPGALRGRPVETLVPEQMRARHPELREAFMRLPTKRAMGNGRDLYGISRSGRVIPLELGLDPVTVEGDVCALVAAVDISQRKAMEERVRTAIDGAASAIIMNNDRGEIVFANRVACELFGYQEEELLNRKIECLVPDRIRQAHSVYRRSFQTARERRLMGAGNALTARCGDGSEKPVEIALAPVETPEGRMVMSTIIDLTERAASERELSRRALEMEALNAELSSFANSASHDLKAPLTSIAGLLNLCIEDLDEGDLPEARANLCRALDISRRSSVKVENVLAIARAGRDRIARETFQLGPELRNIWRDLTAAMDNPPELKLDLNHGDPLTAERPTLTMVFDKLLSNAVRYMDETKDCSTITISTRREDNCLTACVSDNGTGIPEHGLPLLFKMFERIDERSGDGTSLCLVRKQLIRMGGDISAASTPGQGAAFTFSLPLIQEDGHEGSDHRR